MLLRLSIRMVGTPGNVGVFAQEIIALVVHELEDEVIAARCGPGEVLLRDRELFF